MLLDLCITYLPIKNSNIPENARLPNDDTAKKREQLEAQMSDDEKERFAVLEWEETPALSTFLVI